MPAFAFDTLKATRALTAAGMQEPVAEAVVETMNDAVTEGVATKADVAKLETGLAEVKADTAGIKADVGALNSRLNMHQWMFGFNAAMLFLMAGRMFGAY